MVVIDASAWSSSEASALFGVESMSGTVAAVSSAVVESAPGVMTRAVIANVTESPLGSAPIAQTPVTGS